MSLVGADYGSSSDEEDVSASATSTATSSTSVAATASPPRKRARGVRFAGPDMLSTVIVFDASVPIDDTVECDDDDVADAFSSASCTCGLCPQCLASDAAAAEAVAAIAAAEAAAASSSPDDDELDDQSTSGGKLWERLAKRDLDGTWSMASHASDRPQTTGPTTMPQQSQFSSSALRESIPAPSTSASASGAFR